MLSEKKARFLRKRSGFFKDPFLRKRPVFFKIRFLRKRTAPGVRWKMISRVLFYNGKVVLRVGKYQNFRLRRAEGVTTL